LFGLYPWDWVGDDVASFKALQGGLLCAPILQQLILNREPIEVLDFADQVGAGVDFELLSNSLTFVETRNFQVAKWPIKRIIPAHLKNNLQFAGQDGGAAYRAAFSFLEAKGVPRGLPKPLDIDFQTLRDAEVNLLEQ